MTTVRFADLPALIRKYQHRMDAVVAQSAHNVAQIAQTPQPSVKVRGGPPEQGKIPVDTGFLRNSFTSTLMGGTSMSGPDSFVLVTGQMKAGDVVQFGWTAEYARHVEFGTSNMKGAHFATNAVDQWPAIVREVVARAVKEIG